MWAILTWKLLERIQYHKLKHTIFKNNDIHDQQSVKCLTTWDSRKISFDVNNFEKKINKHFIETAKTQSNEKHYKSKSFLPCFRFFVLLKFISRNACHCRKCKKFHHKTNFKWKPENKRRSFKPPYVDIKVLKHCTMLWCDVISNGYKKHDFPYALHICSYSTCWIANKSWICKLLKQQSQKTVQHIFSNLFVAVGVIHTSRLVL